MIRGCSRSTSLTIGASASSTARSTRLRERLEIDAMRAARREDDEVAVAVAGAADEIGGIEHRAAQAIEHRGGVIVDLAVVRDAEIELDAVQARQIDEQARQRAIAVQDRRDLVHPLLVRAEPIDLGLAHAAERPAAPCRRMSLARREEVDAAGATALGAAQRGLGGGQQALGIGGVFGQARDADRQRQLAPARHLRRSRPHRAAAPALVSAPGFAVSGSSSTNSSPE